MKKSILAWFGVRRNKVIVIVLSILLAFSGVVWGCYYFGYGGYINGKVSFAGSYLKKVFRLEKIAGAWGGGKDSGGDSQVKGVSSESASDSVSASSDGLDARLKLLEAQFDGFLLREKSNQVGIDELKTKLEAAITEVSQSNSLLAEQNKNLVSQLNGLQGANASANSDPNTAAAAPPLSAVVNINTATEAELDTLDGIGPSTAKKIIEYRVANGGFKTIEGIMDVSGIGESTFGKIKDKIQV